MFDKLKIMRCVIVEDETIARKGIESYIEKIEWLDCVAGFESATDLDQYLKNVAPDEYPDIIFLDIEMPNISGFEYLASSKVDAEIIIITAYEEYALQGYELNITDYLLKPVSFSRFLKAVEKARNSRICNSSRSALSKVLLLRVDRGDQRIPIANILYIEGMENYLKVFTSCGCATVRMKLKDFLSMVPNEVFMQVHKSYIVNLNNVYRFEWNSIIFSNSKSIPVSRSYRKILSQRLIDMSKD